MQDTTGTFSEATSSVSLREYGDVLRRRRAIILQTFVIILVGGVLVTLFTAPTYQAKARLLVEPPSFGIIQTTGTDPLADMFRVSQVYSIPTQVEMLQEPGIRKRVSEKLSAPLPVLVVNPLEATSIIEVTAEGDNPELVASAPNALLNEYINDVTGSRKRQLQKALELSRGKAEYARKELARLDKAQSDFKDKYKIAEIEATKTDLLGQVTLLGAAFRNAETEYNATRAQAETLRAQLTKTRPDMLGDVRNALTDPRIQSLEDQLVNLNAQKKVLLVDLVDNPDRNLIDPTLLKVNEQISVLTKQKEQLERTVLQRNIRTNPQYQTVSSQLIDVNVQQVGQSEKLKTLGKQLAEAKQNLLKFPLYEKEWSRIQRALKAQTLELEYFGDKEKQLALRENSTLDGSRILQRAEVPISPIRPKRVQNIALAALLGLFFGLCLALLQELFDDRINSPEEAERVLRLPSLGHVPLIEEEGLRLLKDTSTFSPLMESYRSLRTNINFAAVGKPVRSIVITSSVPAEGKSTTVANLAMAMALEHKRIIVVDADLRRPSQHKLFRQESSPGLTNILVGTHSVEEVLRETGVENVRVLPAGSPPPNPAELLGSAAMQRLLEKLEDMADVVLLDSPPTLAVADSIVLASRTDGVLLVVGYGETKKTNTKKAIDFLMRANANVLGTVLNRMDGPSSGYYYGKYYVPGTERRDTPTVAATAPDRALPEASDKKD